MSLIKFAVGSLTAWNALSPGEQALFTNRYNLLWDVITYLRSIDPLTNDYEAVVLDNIDENTWSTNTGNSLIDGNGHYLEIYPYDNRDIIITASHTMHFGNVQNKTFTVKLHGFTITATGGSGEAFISLNPQSGDFLYAELHHNFFKSPILYTRRGILCSGDYINRLKMKCFNNKFYGTSVAIRVLHFGTLPTALLRNIYIENNSIMYCASGIAINYPTGLHYVEIRNNVCSNCHDYCYEGNIDATRMFNNADDDGTFTAHSGYVTGVVDSDFISVDYTSSDYLNISISGKLYGTGTLNITIPENNTDFIGNPRPNAYGTVSIGSYEGESYSESSSESSSISESSSESSSISESTSESSSESSSISESASESISESSSESSSISESFSESASESLSLSESSSLSESESESASASPSREIDESPVAYLGMEFDGMHAVMVHAEQTLYEMFYGEPCSLIKKKETGTRCPKCWSEARQQRILTHCDVCRGSGMVNGYYCAGTIRIAFDSDDKKNDSQRNFEDVYNSIRARASNNIIIRPKDLIVNRDDNKRYSVLHVETTKLPIHASSGTILSKRNHIVSQLLSLQELNPDDNEYDMNIDLIPPA